MSENLGIEGVPFPVQPATYIANVLLPTSLLNLNQSNGSSLTTFQNCPKCNNELLPVAESSSGSSFNNPLLTNFGNFFIKLIVGEFNTTFGTTFNDNDFRVETNLNNDQNSICSYVLTALHYPLTIICYIELSEQIHVSIRFEENGEAPVPNLDNS